MKEERIRILNMIQDQTLTVDEGVALLGALVTTEDMPDLSVPPPPLVARWLRIRVTDGSSGKQTANIRLPLSFAKFGLKMGGLTGLEADELQEAFAQATLAENGTVLEVDEGLDGERVEIYVE